MSNTKSNPDTLIASFLLPWKVTNHSTGKEQPNNHKKPCAWILPVLQCLQNPRGLSLFQGKFSQKVKKPKSFRLFEFFEFFDFSSRNLLACELFDFSTFRGQTSWFSRCDRYQPEEHTEGGTHLLTRPSVPVNLVWHADLLPLLFLAVGNYVVHVLDVLEPCVVVLLHSCSFDYRSRIHSRTRCKISPVIRLLLELYI